MRGHLSLTDSTDSIRFDRIAKRGISMPMRARDIETDAMLARPRIRRWIEPCSTKWKLNSSAIMVALPSWVPITHHHVSAEHVQLQGVQCRTTMCLWGSE